MWKFSLHSLRNRIWQLLLCLVAIVLGVAGVSAAVSLNALVRTTTEGVVAATAADITIVPAGSLAAADAVTSPPPLAPDTIAAIADLPGVQDAHGQIRGGVLFPITTDGVLLQPQLAPTITGSYLSAEPHGDLPAIAVTEGRVPTGDDEVAMDRPTLEVSGYTLGDVITFARTGPNAPIRSTVVGIVRLDRDRPAGASYALFSEAAARAHFLGGQAGFNSVWVDAGDDADVAALIEQIRPLIPSEYQIVDGDAVASATQFQLHPRLTVAQIGLWVAGGLLLVVAAALISSTTSSLVARRRGESAFLRRLGASPWRVSLPIITESLLLGLVGSAVGLPLGQGLAEQLNNIGRTHGLALGAVIPELSPPEAWLCIGIGVAIAVLAAHRHATAVSFTQSLEPRPTLPRPRLHFSDAAWTSVGLVVVGVGLLAVGTVVPNMPVPWVWAVLGATVVLVGVPIATPVLGAPLVRLIGLLGRPALRDVSTLSARNVDRHPARFAKAAAALVLGTGLVATFAILGASGRASAHHDLPQSVHGDLFITSIADGGFHREFASLVSALPGVEAVNAYGIQTALQGGEPRRVMVADPGVLEAVVDHEVIEGRPPAAADEVMLEAEHAASSDLERGDSFNLVINQQRVEVRVVGIFRTGRGVDLAELTAIRATFNGRGVADRDAFVAVSLASGSPVAEVKREMTDLVGTNPLLRVQNMDELADARGESLAIIADTVESALTLLAWIAVVWITGTLLIAVHERSPEFRSLRLVGMDRWQVASMVALEAITMGTVGGLLGTAAGTVAGWGLQRGFVDRGYPLLEIPWDTLWGLVGTGVLVGLASAVLPTLAAVKSLGPFLRPERSLRPETASESPAEAV